MHINFKKLWFWFSAILVTGEVAFAVFSVPSLLKQGMYFSFYSFYVNIFAIATFLFLLYIVVKLANRKIYPNYFLWFIFFATIASMFIIASAH